MGFDNKTHVSVSKHSRDKQQKSCQKPNQSKTLNIFSPNIFYEKYYPKHSSEEKNSIKPDMFLQGHKIPDKDYTIWIEKISNIPQYQAEIVGEVRNDV